VDYIDDERASKGIREVFLNEGLCQTSDLPIKRAYCYDGLKIGGSPFWLRDDDAKLGRLTGRFLCSMTHVLPYCDAPYPWINSARPLASRIPKASERLYWYDGFVLNFFLAQKGEIQVHYQASY
jgi:hypothetical protein